MGLFSSTYKTYVGTSVSRFIDSKEFISSKTKGLIAGINRKEDVTEHVLENLVSSAGFRAKKAFRYAGDGYVFGRPNDTLFAKNSSSATASVAITDYLTSLGALSVDYTEYGTYNYYHKTFEYLKNTQNFNFMTGNLPYISSVKGKPVTVYSIDLLCNPTDFTQPANSFDFIGLYPVNIKSSTDVSKVGLEITYRWIRTVTLPPTSTNTSTGDVLLFFLEEPYAGGTADYVNTYETPLPPETSAPVDYLSTEPAAPPTIYDEIQVVDTRYTVSIKTFTVIERYTALTGVLRTETYERTDTTTHSSIVKQVPSQETVLLSSSFEYSETAFSKTVYLAGYKNSSNEQSFFSYEYLDGIAYLDNIFVSGYSSPGDYLPRLYFRWDHTSSGANTASVEYLHGKRMAKKLAIEYDDVIEAVHTVDGDRTQADLDEVKSAFLMYAVPADATDQVELMYLYKHFEEWYGIVDGTVTTESLVDFNNNYQYSDNNEHVLIIEDTRFKLTIGMQSVWKRTVVGSIGAVDTYGTAKGELNVTSVVEGVVTVSNVYPWHVYRHQTTATTYTEYQVVGLETKYYVADNHSTASGYTADVADPSDILYVPVNYTIVKEMPVFVQEELMYKSMQIIANSVVVVKVKWYQRSGWLALFKIAALVALVYGFSQGFELLYALTTLATVSLVWALELLVTYVVQYLSAVVATQLFVRVAGEDLAMLTAILLVVTGTGKSLGLNIPYATELLSYGNSLFQEVGKSLGNQLNVLKGEYASFVKESKEDIDEIQAALEEFDNPNQKYAKILLGQTPSEFLNKVHVGNIGTKVFDVIPNYVKLSLDLSLKPTYSEV